MIVDETIYLWIQFPQSSPSERPLRAASPINSTLRLRVNVSKALCIFSLQSDVSVQSPHAEFHHFTSHVLGAGVGAETAFNLH